VHIIQIIVSEGRKHEVSPYALHVAVHPSLLITL
jgi:hypothetical protein